MELEGEVQDQAQKIIEMPQRDRATSASENQPSSASVVSMYGQERPSIPSLHQQLAGASGTQTIQLREEFNRRRSGATIRRVLHGYLLGPSGRGGKPGPSKGLLDTSVRFGRPTGSCISPIGGLG